VQGCAVQEEGGRRKEEGGRKRGPLTASIVRSGVMDQNSRASPFPGFHLRPTHSSKRCVLTLPSLNARRTHYSTLLSW